MAEGVAISATNPSSVFDDSIVPKFMEHDTGLGFTEQLYTARGSQGFGTLYKIKSHLIDPQRYEDTFILAYRVGWDMENVSYDIRPLWTAKSRPDFLAANGVWGMM